MPYVGVDAHKATSHITVMDDAGKVLQRKQVSSSLLGLRQALGRYHEPMKAVLEASYTWGPMYDWLDELVDDVVFAHPAKVRAIADARIKTDKIDSETLAHLLRTNLIPEAYAPSKRYPGRQTGPPPADVPGARPDDGEEPHPRVAESAPPRASNRQ